MLQGCAFDSLGRSAGSASEVPPPVSEAASANAESRPSSCSPPGDVSLNSAPSVSSSFLSSLAGPPLKPWETPLLSLLSPPRAPSALLLLRPSLSFSALNPRAISFPRSSKHFLHLNLPSLPRAAKPSACRAASSTTYAAPFCTSSRTSSGISCRGRPRKMFCCGLCGRVPVRTPGIRWCERRCAAVAGLYT